MSTPRSSRHASSRDRGQRFEHHAAVYLERMGCVILFRNFHCPLGEIDLIVSDAGVTAFVEVRFRKAGAQVKALESISMAKRVKLVRTARYFIMKHREHDQRPCRFDVLAMDGVGDELAVNWIKDAFHAF